MENTIIETLPKSWEELKLRDYQKIVQAFADSSVINSSTDLEGLFANADMTIKVISALTGKTTGELEALPMKDIAKADEKLKFLNAIPKANKQSRIEWKKLDEITYNDFITWNQYANNFMDNMQYVITAFAKNSTNPDEVLEMNMQEVFSGFFLLRRTLNKLTNSMLRQSAASLLKIQAKQATKALHSRFRLKKQKKGN